MSLPSRRARRTDPGQRPVPALRFRLFGFPVQADASFLLISAMIGFGLPASKLAIWVGVAALAVLGHELGHAFAARFMGAEARIELAGLGGLTHWRTERPLSKVQQAVVTAAGPGAGFLLSIPVVLLLAGLDWDGWTAGGFALRAGAWATFGWSVLNLVPIPPLDGGALLELALPGDAITRKRNAAKVGTAVGAAAAVLAFQSEMQFTALFAGMLAFQNWATVKNLTEAAPGAAPGPAKANPVVARLQEANDLFGRGDHQGAVALAGPLAGDTLIPDDWRVTARLISGLSLVALGRPDEAVGEAAATRGCPEGLGGYVQAADGDGDAGVAAARRAFERTGSREAAGWLVEALIATRRFDEAADFVDTEDVSLLPSFTTWRLMAASFAYGAMSATGRVGDAVAACGRPESAHAAYNAAAAWSRAGDTTRAMASVERAVRLGWADLAQVDSDPNLTALRSRPDWATFRAGVEAPS